MHVAKNNIPIKIDAPGAVARHLPGFGLASGALAAEYFSLAAGTDLAPLLEGLTNNACQAAHWGYLITGDVVITYTDGNEETCTAGDVFYWHPGHSVRVNADAELVLFSPQAEHAHVLEHILAKLAPA
jgi:hypothetical protein